MADNKHNPNLPDAELEKYEDTQITEEPARQTSGLHSMRDVVAEITKPAENTTDEAPEKPKGEASTSPKRPKVSGKKSSKQKSTTVKRLSEAILGDKKLRRDSSGTITLFGHRINYWSTLAIAFALIVFLALVLNGNSLVSVNEKVTVIGIDQHLDGYKILMLSDLNGRRFGDKQIGLFREIDGLDYNIVICLGDMVGEGGDPEPFYELLDGLPSRKQVYFICGDSDPGPFTSNVRGTSGDLDELVLADWILGAESRGAIYVDRPTLIEANGGRIWLSPSGMLNTEMAETLNLWKDQVSQEESGYLAGIVADMHSLPYTTYRMRQTQDTLDAINSMTSTDLQISLSHVPVPDSILDSADAHSAADGKYLPSPGVALAGHYCGGVWNIPLLGAFYIPDSAADRYGWLPSQDKVAGHRQVGDIQVYVSRGLSTSGDTPLMPFRLMNNPEIEVLTLTAALPMNIMD